MPWPARAHQSCYPFVARGCRSTGVHHVLVAEMPRKTSSRHAQLRNATFGLKQILNTHRDEMRRHEMAELSDFVTVSRLPADLKGNVDMSNFEIQNEGRKAWSAPELRRLQAGAAEQGSATIADGGPVATPRS